ncbi:MAG: hypothetical protein EA403_06805 [Spirochaetaceae bacterium]|nr:MAG: hypothetical protein EA403_06805 [Spirochaetaceae bacterium]
MFKAYVALAALFCSVTLAPSGGWAYNPPAGGEEWHDIVSPTFLATGADVTAHDAILGGSVNPAASALRDRLTIGLGYATLFRAGTQEGVGHIASLGADLPTNFGVLGLHSTFLTSPHDDFDLGTLVRVRGIYAREVFPGWLFGASGNVTTGRADRSFVGLTGAAGIIRIHGSWLGLSDIRWGTMIDGLGIGYNPHRNDEEGTRQTAFPSVFTPAAGVSFNVLESEGATVRLASRVSLPRFQNLRANLGLSVSMQDVVTAQIGTRVDLNQVGEDRSSHQRSALPSLGFELNVGNLIARRSGVRRDGELDRPARTLRTQLSATPLTGSVFAIGTGAEFSLNVPRSEPPGVILETSERQYFAPNFDGVNDELLIPVRIETSGLLSGFRLLIVDSDGIPVREIRNPEERPETIGVPEIVQEIRAGARSIPVPAELVWDGRRDDGRIAADGEYRFFVEAWNQLGGRSQSAMRTVVLDTVPPELAVDTDDERVFAPVAETGRRTFSIRQSGERVPSLTATITDSEGEIIRRFEWADQEPEDLVWDGTDEEGTIVSDGVFQYQITATDRAGNRSTRTVENIVVASERVGVFVTANRAAFSPNGDGVADTVTFSLLFTTTEELTNWQLEVIDQGGTVVRRWAGSGPPEVRGFEWDGAGAPDGTYRPRLTARYAFGQEPQATGSAVVLDTTPPEVRLSLQPRPFSPDGDGVEDELSISLDVQNRTAIDRWQIEIFDQQGRLFHDFGGRGEPRRDYRWNGVSSTTGRLVDSATEYRVVATVTDEVGNTAVTEGSALVDILVIRDGDRLFIRIGNINFAPNSPQFVTDDPNLTRRNLEILDRLAEILTRFDGHSIRIEGHAVNITGTAREHEQTLVPLSTARAEAIREALVERGINPRRLSVLGKGGNEPLVPHTDLEERWRNRRVEFVLIR